MKRYEGVMGIKDLLRPYTDDEKLQKYKEIKKEEKKKDGETNKQIKEKK